MEAIRSIEAEFDEQYWLIYIYSPIPVHSDPSLHQGQPTALRDDNHISGRFREDMKLLGLEPEFGLLFRCLV
jgi:hypothetical protein